MLDKYNISQCLNRNVENHSLLGYFSFENQINVDQ
jgi:hypothetical protein